MYSYNNALLVTPSDDVGLGFTASALTLDAAGTVTVDMAGGQKNVTLTLPAGWAYVRVTKVYATGTTANITVYW